MKNIFYFKKICKLGGTEQFLYEIAKKYSDYDITIYYDKADSFQLERLRKFVKCIKRNPNETIKCDRAFYNFNIDIINQVEAKEHIFVCHANYEELGYKPPIEHPKLTRFIGVSKFACDKLNEYADKLGIKTRAELCYNPLTLEPKEKVLKFICACRLDDEVKGGKRVLKLIESLDKISQELNKKYIMFIFSRKPKISITSKNVILMEPTVDVRKYIANSDILVTLSNDMETYCYSNNEAWSYGVHTITTPLSVNNELNIPKEANYVCEYDMSNVDDIVKQIFTEELKPFTYKAPEDNWKNLLAQGKSTYKENANKMYKVKAIITYYDNYYKKKIEKGTIFDVIGYRLDVLLGENEYKIKMVELIGDE